MKQAFWLLIGVGLVLCLGAAGYLVRGEYTFQGTWQDEWQPCGADAGEPNGIYADQKTAPGATQYNKAYVDSHYQTFDIPAYWNYCELSPAATVESSTDLEYTFTIFVSDGVGDYMLGCIVYFDTTNVAHSISGSADTYYRSGLIGAIEYVVKGEVVGSTSGTYLYRFDRRWIKRIAIVPTAVAEGSAALEIIGY